MKDFYKRDFLEFASPKVLLFGTQLMLSATALGLFLWSLTTYIKYRIVSQISLELYDWTYIFFRPVKSALINYLVACLIFGVGGLILYLWKNRLRLERWQDVGTKIPLPLLLFSLLVSIGLLASLTWTGSRAWIMFKAFFVFCVPFPLFLWNRLNLEGKIADFFYIFLSLMLLLLVSLEPIRVVREPVLFMNDFPDIFGETYLKGGKVSNKTFLENLSKVDVDALRLVYDVKMSVENFKELRSGENLDSMPFSRNLTNRDLRSALRYVESAIENSELWQLKLRGIGYTNAEHYINHLKNIDVEEIQKFSQANFVENLHQNMGRGQINHIGHILNPINEYNLGKPLGEIYFQYNLGSTFILKWIMEWSGGPSIENYYKTYILYVFYFLSYFVMVVFLFKEPIYVFAGLAILPICFYFMGYILFILAPGFIPIIHFLDVPTIIFLFLFYRRQRLAYGIIGGALAISSILLNRLFGTALAVSFLISLLVYILEAKDLGKKYAWIFFWILLLAITILVFSASAIGSGNRILTYFLLGYFSWPASPLTIAATLSYLVTSYIFIIYLREKRFDFKYLYIFIFFYAQIILTYYFWSGLSNHLPPLFPFIWMQVILTLYIIQKYLAGEGTLIQKMARQVTQILIIGTMILILPTGIKFYKEKEMFQQNFIDHPVYQWSFDRAKVISTVDPRLIQGSIALIQKYSSPNHLGIFIISKYDGLIPFLAHRYSAMPMFEMGPFLFSKSERDDAIRRIQEEKPAYLYVDTNIQDPPADLWAKLFQSEFFKKERISRLGRYEILREIFIAVRDSYEKVEGGNLISVYERKPR